MTRVGLIARADDRGLGILTQEFHRNLQPDKTLVVATGNPDFPDHIERFRYGKVYSCYLQPDMSLSESTVREFLRDLDVVYSAETFYDWRIIGQARDMGVKTVCHGMPELCHHARKRTLPKPDEWWWPTTWMLNEIPAGRLMPIPTTGMPIGCADPHEPGPLRVTHPGGKKALADRDGTEIFIQAIQMVTEEVDATIFSQDGSYEFAYVTDNVKVRTRPGPADRFDMYRDFHVMVLPRRYGGLSLKVNESLDVGVPAILPAVDPNQEWPGPRTPSTRGRRILVPFGPLTTRNADPVAIAKEIDALAADRSVLHVEQQQAKQWASENSWKVWRPEYQIALESAASRK